MNSDRLDLISNPDQPPFWDCATIPPMNARLPNKKTAPRKIRPAGLSVIFVFLAACSTTGPIQREQLVNNLGPVLQIEEQARNLAQEQQMLRFSGWLGEEGNRQFKNHYDVYYVYHAAAISHLAYGEIPLYIECVHLAQSELDAMRKILDLTREKAGEEFRPFRIPRPMPAPPPDESPGSSGDPT